MIGKVDFATWLSEIACKARDHPDVAEKSLERIETDDSHRRSSAEDFLIISQGEGKSTSLDSAHGPHVLSQCFGRTELAISGLIPSSQFVTIS